MASIKLFHASELDAAQQLKLNGLRTDVLAMQRAISEEITAAQNPDSLGAVIVEKQRDLVERTLVGVLELRATLSPAQGSSFVHRAAKSARAARRDAAELMLAGGNDSQIALLQMRADIIDQLASSSPDATNLRALGSAFVAAHALTPDVSSVSRSIAVR